MLLPLASSPMSFKCMTIHGNISFGQDDLFLDPGCSTSATWRSVETIGVFGPDTHMFLKELAHHICHVSGEYMFLGSTLSHSSPLTQRLPVTIQLGGGLIESSL